MRWRQSCRPKRQENGDWRKATLRILLKAEGHARGLTEHILWTLTINAMNLEVDGDVRVGAVQDGHKLVTDSQYLRNDWNEPGYFGGDTAIEIFKQLFPGSTFK